MFLGGCLISLEMEGEVDRVYRFGINGWRLGLYVIS